MARAGCARRASSRSGTWPPSGFGSTSSPLARPCLTLTSSARTAQRATSASSARCACCGWWKGLLSTPPESPKHLRPGEYFARFWIRDRLFQIQIYSTYFLWLILLSICFNVYLFTVNHNIIRYFINIFFYFNTLGELRSQRSAAQRLCYIIIAYFLLL